MRNLLELFGCMLLGPASVMIALVFLSGCESRPVEHRQIEGILEEVDGTGRSNCWYRLKFKGGMTIVLRNQKEPFYLGHFQTIYFTGNKTVTRIVCKDYDPENPKNVVVKYEGDRIYVDKSKMVFGEKVYKMVPIEETMESVE